ncbi:hypothetical protein [Streptomyces sp. 4R-3d]|uniref:hypothetical protein n=1 Tax=Streptomyces sp. 4R-3d TaxID=2559605 RepID=UPI00142F8EDF|nr:hypothetical protein [Streptomyces sp. 4R-3d]
MLADVADNERFVAFLMKFRTEQRKEITIFSRALTNEPTATRFTLSPGDLPEPDPKKKLHFFRIYAAVA